jgi:sirohydrochlorin ferrochelatase
MTTPRHALIVAHGSPSAPEGPEAAFALLAAAAEALLPGWRVRAATLAAPGALDRACADLPEDRETPLLPFFMTDGWFVSSELRRRVETAASDRRVRFLPPFGMAPEISILCARRAQEGAAAAGIDPAEATLIVAAHGSPSDPRPARATEALAETLRASAGFAAVRTGYVDEAPALADALKVEGPALCLPFFIGFAGHVETDLPEAAAEAGFAGPVLPPVGADPEAPALIAEQLRRA